MDELHGRQKIIAQLVEARLEQGVSQAELARRVGTQRSNICRLEGGLQNPTLDMILKIASALGKDVSLLLDDKEEPMSNIYSFRIYDTELMRFSMEKARLCSLSLPMKAHRWSLSAAVWSCSILACSFSYCFSFSS